MSSASALATTCSGSVGETRAFVDPPRSRGAHSEHSHPAHPARVSGSGNRRSSRSAAVAPPPPLQPGEARPDDYLRTPARRSRAGKADWPCRSFLRPQRSQPASWPATACP
eukprot:scaffold45527_cov56-Phaeocystis_antarctica.AAC.2